MLFNVAVRTRLLVALLVLFVACATIGGFAYVNLIKLSLATDALGQDWLPSTRILGNLSQNFERYRSREAQVALLRGEEQKLFIEKLQKSHDDILNDLKEYEPLIDKGDEERLAKDMKLEITNYISMNSEFMDRVKSGDHDKVALYLIGDLQNQLDKARKAIELNRKFNAERGNQAATDASILGTDTRTKILIALCITTVICSAIAWMCVKTISGPISRMSGIMQRISRGDLDVAIPNSGERSEIGAMAAAVDVFRQGLVHNRALETEADQMRGLAESQRRQAMNHLAADFEGAIGGIVDVVSTATTQMQVMAAQLTASVQDTSTQSNTVSAAAEEASANVNAVSSSAEKLGASLEEIAQQVTRSAQKSQAAVREAESTASIVSELSTAASRIGDIVEIISNIAGQTNLLALNATIEAARAGEAGRGFAIVASEVKGLAAQTANATKEISQQIGAIQKTTEKAVAVIEGIAKTITEIDSSSEAIATSVDRQGSATQEIVTAVSQASVGTSVVTSSITGVARTAQQTGVSATQVLVASAELAKNTELLRSKVQSFLASVRAA